MKTLNNYLDDLKEVCGSDYRAAKRLGIAKTTLSTVRKRQSLNDELALKIAEILRVDPSEILLAAMIARSDGAVKIAWEKISNQIGHAAALLYLVRHGSPDVLTVIKSGLSTAWCILC